jgi:hypothetical protein
MEEAKEKLSFEEIQALIKATDKENPNPEDLKAMRRHLNENSTLVRLNEFSEQAFKRVIETSTKSALMKELLERQIEEKRESFGYQTATIFERMIIDQVILCHLRLNSLEMTHTSKLDGSHSLEHGLYWDKRLNSAQRRFTRACEALAKVKKLLAEADLKDQQAKNKRGQSTLIAQKILENATK